MKSTVVTEWTAPGPGNQRAWGAGGMPRIGTIVLCPDEQTFPFIVPGLLDMARGEIKNRGRADIRVKMDGDPPFPHRIELGPVFLDGQPVSGTEAVVTLEKCTPR